MSGPVLYRTAAADPIPPGGRAWLPPDPPPPRGRLWRAGEWLLTPGNLEPALLLVIAAAAGLLLLADLVAWGLR